MGGTCKKGSGTAPELLLLLLLEEAEIVLIANEPLFPSVLNSGPVKNMLKIRGSRRMRR